MALRRIVPRFALLRILPATADRAPARARATLLDGVLRVPGFWQVAQALRRNRKSSVIGAIVSKVAAVHLLCPSFLGHATGEFSKLSY